MKNETARAFVIARIDDRQLSELHRHENELGYCLPAGMIAVRCRKWGNGEIPREIWEPVERIAFRETSRAMESELESSKQEGGDPNYMGAQHAVDFLIRQMSLSYREGIKEGTANQVMKRIRRGKDQAAGE